MAILKTPPTSLDKSVLVAPYVNFDGVAGMPPIERVASPTSGDILPLSYKLGVNSIEGGALLPRLTSDERDALETITAGMRIFNTTTAAIETYNGAAWIAGGSNGFFSLASITLTPLQIESLPYAFILVPYSSSSAITFPIKATTIFQKNGSDFVTTANIRIAWRNPDHLLDDAIQAPFSPDIFTDHDRTISFQYGRNNATIGLQGSGLFGASIIVHADNDIVNNGDDSGRLRIDLLYKTQTVA